MSARLENIFDRSLLEQMLEDRYVKITHHPELPLRILNYTSRAQYDGVWNEVTRACRGLIINEHDHVVARPFAKFFNADQHGYDNLPTGAVHVTEKLDGSLGILYPSKDGYAVATRGSFTSDQALHATAIWQERYQASSRLNPSWTYLCEIIYPKNRIVVDYSGLDDLVLLGAVDITSGRSIPLDEALLGWPGPVVDEHPYDTVAVALATPERSNAEGLVIHFTAEDLRVKLKHAEYVKLHRLFTGVSERRVWEALSEGVDLEEWLSDVPDEFYDFVHGTRVRMLGEYEFKEHEMRQHLAAVLAELSGDFSRRDFAEAVTRLERTYTLAKGLFALHDGKNHAKLIWATIRPAEHVPLFQQNLDAE